MKKAVPSLLLALVTLAASGCLGLTLAGEAVRARQKKIDIVYAPGISAATMGQVRSFGISVSGVDASGVVVAGGAGATNSNVYSDMISQDLLRRGYYASALGEVVTEGSDRATFQRLRERGMDIVLAGSMNMSASTSVFSSLTGGDWSNTGVNAFTVKALDAGTGRVLFILSAQYGTAKKLGRVIGDLGETLKEALGSGVLTTVAAPSFAAIEPRSEAPLQAEAPSSAAPAPDVRASPQPMLSLSVVQRRLNEMGFRCGVPDGRMGTRTRACLEAFQTRQGLPVTGRLDQATSDAVQRN